MNKKFKLRRLAYYIQSFFTIILAVKPGTRWRFFYELIPGVTPVKHMHLRNPDLEFACLTYLDLLVAKEVIIDGEYESHEVQVTNRDKTIVDIGAGFGDFAVLCAKKYPRAQVFAFEPDIRYFKLLSESVRINKVPNVKIFDAPINGLKELIKVTGPIDVLKIDTEGAEYKILSKENSKVMKQVKKMTIEFHPSPLGSVQSLRVILQKAGFVVGVYPQEFAPEIGHLTAVYNK